MPWRAKAEEAGSAARSCESDCDSCADDGVRSGGPAIASWRESESCDARAHDLIATASAMPTETASASMNANENGNASGTANGNV
jgi:hypothetical protein